jgi:hypothetical protein
MCRVAIFAIGLGLAGYRTIRYFLLLVGAGNGIHRLHVPVLGKMLEGERDSDLMSRFRTFAERLLQLGLLTRNVSPITLAIKPTKVIASRNSNIHSVYGGQSRLH